MNFWQGERVRLRGIEPSDAAAFFAWNEDSEMARRLDQVWVPVSRTFVERWAAEQALRGPEEDAFKWVIETHAGEIVGSIDTHQCDRRVGTFAYGVAIRREYQHQGFASEAIRLVLRYLFDELRYQKATVHIHADNAPSIRLHERLGFQLEGRLRRMHFSGGRYVDGLVYGLTVEEFHAGEGDRCNQKAAGTPTML